jgi:hypothetical protein
VRRSSTCWTRGTWHRRRSSRRWSHRSVRRCRPSCGATPSNPVPWSMRRHEATSSARNETMNRLSTHVWAHAAVGMDRCRRGHDRCAGRDRPRLPVRGPGRRPGPLRLRHESFVTVFAVAGDQLIEPAAGDVVCFAHLLDALALDEHGVDNIASQIHAHSPWSCPLCLATGIRDLLKPDTPSPTRCPKHNVWPGRTPLRVSGRSGTFVLSFRPCGPALR